MNKTVLASSVLAIFSLVITYSALGQTTSPIGQSSRNTKPYYLDEHLIFVIAKDKKGRVGIYKSFIPLRNPDRKKDPDVGFGTMRVFPSSASSKKNGNGDAYRYMEAKMDATWKAKLSDGTTVGSKELEKFWDWVYKDYKKESEVDFSKNCHGHSFGVGDWPQSASPLLALGPFSIDSGKSPVYQNTSLKLAATATIAADLRTLSYSGEYLTLAGTKHSIKVEGDKCEVGRAERHALIRSSEKYRESGVYTQSSTCPTNVSLTKNNIANGKLDARLKFSFGLFEPFRGGKGKAGQNGE